MSLIHSTDPDFRVCQIHFDALIAIQLEAEQRGWAARWSSVDALRSQVGEGVIALQTLMREERDGVIRAYRCLVMFSAAEGENAGGVVTVDIDPSRLESLERIDRESGARRVLEWAFSLAVGGISMVSKA